MLVSSRHRFVVEILWRVTEVSRSQAPQEVSKASYLVPGHDVQVE